jgi:hypothetical protein
VLLAVREHGLEAGAEQRGDALRGVARGRQRGALRRAVLGERADDGVAARGERGGEDLDVPPAVVGRRQEVQDRPVVPERVGPVGVPAEQVRGQPADAVTRGAEPAPRDAEADRREVEDGEVLEAGGQQAVDEGGGATADVDHRGGRVDAGARDQRQRHARLGLVPAEAILGARVRGVPVRG